MTKRCSHRNWRAASSATLLVASPRQTDEKVAGPSTLGITVKPAPAGPGLPYEEPSVYAMHVC